MSNLLLRYFLSLSLSLSRPLVQVPFLCYCGGLPSSAAHLPASPDAKVSVHEYISTQDTEPIVVHHSHSHGSHRTHPPHNLKRPHAELLSTYHVRRVYVIVWNILRLERVKHVWTQELDYAGMSPFPLGINSHLMSFRRNDQNCERSCNLNFPSRYATISIPELVTFPIPTWNSYMQQKSVSTVQSQRCFDPMWTSSGLTKSIHQWRRSSSDRSVTDIVLLYCNIKVSGITLFPYIPWWLHMIVN